MKQWELGSRPMASCQQGKPTYSNRRALNRTLGLRARQGVPPPRARNLVAEYGAGQAAMADVLSMGSAFYFYDFSVPMGDPRADQIRC